MKKRTAAFVALIFLGISCSGSTGDDSSSIASPPSPTTTTAVAPTATTELPPTPTVTVETPSAAPTPTVTETRNEVQAAIVIHLDPNGHQHQHATVQNWERLINAVNAAERHGHKLTLLMSADWSELIEESPQRKNTLEDWITDGHEVGFHLHTCAHVSPDGYRDVQHRCKGAENRGSVNVAFNKVHALLNGFGAEVMTAAQGPNTSGTFRSAEWQNGVVFATGVMKDNTDGHSEHFHRFITLPRCTGDYGNNYSGSQSKWPVAEMGHAQLNVGAFTTNQSQNNLAALEAEIQLLKGGRHSELNLYLGVVFHAREYAESPRQTTLDSYDTDKDYLDAVFSLFSAAEVLVLPVREILSADNPCG